MGGEAVSAWSCPKCSATVEADVFDGSEVRCRDCGACLVASVLDDGGPAYFVEHADDDGETGTQ